MKQAHIYMHNQSAGQLIEDDNGFHFSYFSDYLILPSAVAVSLTLPLTSQTYFSKTLFPFFDGLIPEGWLLEITVKSWKVDPRDRMGLLMVSCIDCIGAVSVHPVSESDHE